MFSAAIYRCDINKYSTKEIEEQFRLTNLLIEISKSEFNVDHYLSMKGYAGDELIQTFHEFNNKGNLYSLLNNCIQFQEKFEQDSNASLKSSLIIGPFIRPSDETSFKEQFKNGILYADSKEVAKMRERNTGELGKFVGIPLIASARLLSVSAEFDKEYDLILGVFPEKNGNNFKYRVDFNDNELVNNFLLKEIRLDTINSKAQETKKVSENLKRYVDELGFKIYGIKRK